MSLRDRKDGTRRIKEILHCRSSPSARTPTTRRWPTSGPQVVGPCSTSSTGAGPATPGGPTGPGATPREVPQAPAQARRPGPIDTQIGRLGRARARPDSRPARRRLRRRSDGLPAIGRASSTTVLLEAAVPDSRPRGAAGRGGRSGRHELMLLIWADALAHPRPRRGPPDPGRGRRSGILDRARQAPRGADPGLSEPGSEGSNRWPGLGDAAGGRSGSVRRPRHDPRRPTRWATSEGAGAGTAIGGGIGRRSPSSSRPPARARSVPGPAPDGGLPAPGRAVPSQARARA